LAHQGILLCKPVGYACLKPIFSSEEIVDDDGAFRAREIHATNNEELW